MSKSGRKVLREALQLEAADRAEVAAELLASLDGEQDADAEAAWATEIDRRAERARSGDDTGQPWTDVLDRARDSLSEH